MTNIPDGQSLRSLVKQFVPDEDAQKAMFKTIERVTKQLNAHCDGCYETAENHCSNDCGDCQCTEACKSGGYWDHIQADFCIAPHQDCESCPRSGVCDDI